MADPEAMGALTTCLVCHQGTLARHCRATIPDCGWRKCRNRDCGVTLDLLAWTGFDKAGKRVAYPPLTPPEPV